MDMRNIGYPESETEGWIDRLELTSKMTPFIGSIVMAEFRSLVSRLFEVKKFIGRGWGYSPAPRIYTQETWTFAWGTAYRDGPS